MSSFSHQPVLLAKALEGIRPEPGGRYADGTVGGGGHALALLKASAPDGWLFGCDRDGAAIEAARQILAPFAGRFELRQGAFAELPDWVPSESCQGALLDLGVSSPQLDQASRGFSFQHDGPLDMRMDTRQPLTAADLVNRRTAAELQQIFSGLGQERRAPRIAEAIVRERQIRPFRTTLQLANFVETIAPRRGHRIHPATRVFQALRMAVNDELPLLERGLEAVWKILTQGGRLAVITFHSLEDRIVKEFGRRLARDYTVSGPVDVPELRQPARPQLRWVWRKAVQPSPDEVARNPRSRSAQLRVMEKIVSHA